MIAFPFEVLSDVTVLDWIFQLPELLVSDKSAGVQWSGLDPPCHATKIAAESDVC